MTAPPTSNTTTPTPDDLLPTTTYFYILLPTTLLPTTYLLLATYNYCFHELIDRRRARLLDIYIHVCLCMCTCYYVCTCIHMHMYMFRHSDCNQLLWHGGAHCSIHSLAGTQIVGDIEGKGRNGHAGLGS